MALDTLRAPRPPQLTVTGDSRAPTRLIQAARTHRDPRLLASPGGLPKACVGQNQSLNSSPQHSHQGGAAARERGAGIFLSSSACLRVCSGCWGSPNLPLWGAGNRSTSPGGSPLQTPSGEGGRWGAEVPGREGLV